MSARTLLNGSLENVTVVLNGYGVAVVKFVHVRAGHAPIVIRDVDRYKGGPGASGRWSKSLPLPTTPFRPGSALRISPSPAIVLGEPYFAIVAPEGFLASPRAITRPTRPQSG